MASMCCFYRGNWACTLSILGAIYRAGGRDVPTQARRAMATAASLRKSRFYKAHTSRIQRLRGAPCTGSDAAMFQEKTFLVREPCIKAFWGLFFEWNG